MNVSPICAVETLGVLVAIILGPVMMAGVVVEVDVVVVVGTAVVVVVVVVEVVGTAVVVLDVEEVLDVLDVEVVDAVEVVDVVEVVDDVVEVVEVVGRTEPGRQPANGILCASSVPPTFVRDWATSVPLILPNPIASQFA